MSIDPEVSDSSIDSAIKATGTKIGMPLDVSQQRDFIANSNIFISGAIKNLPFMMFFLLPFFCIPPLGSILEK